MPALLRTDDDEEELPAADVEVGAMVGDDEKIKG
jgi:hypothetical protein